MEETVRTSPCSCLFFALFVVLESLLIPPQAQSLDTGLSTRAGAYAYSRPEESLIGFEQQHVIRNKESLLEVARQYGLGYNEIVDANPGIDPWVPTEGTRIRIPTSWILPQAEGNGIVINLSEMRLYYYLEMGLDKMVITFPIGIGQEGFETPAGVYSITEKVRNPTWYPPPSIRAEYPAHPAFIPAGADNPLGEFWFQLSIPGYGIHGTNKPFSLGRRVSRGCIRLYPEDIQWLAKSVSIGIRVEIVNQPIKIGYKNNRLYIEINRTATDFAALYEEIHLILEKEESLGGVDDQALQRAIKTRDGIPVLISK